MKTVHFSNIKWDTDGETIDLPDNYTTEVPMELDVAEQGADLLSDKFGFCVFSFDFEEKSKKSH